MVLDLFGVAKYGVVMVRSIPGKANSPMGVSTKAALHSKNMYKELLRPL